MEGEEEFKFQVPREAGAAIAEAEREANTNVISTAELYKWFAVQGLYSVSSSSLTVSKIMRLA